MAVVSLLAPAGAVKPVNSDRNRATAYAAGWQDFEKAKALVVAIVSAHKLSFSLPTKVRRRIGYLEGRAVRVRLAHGWDWSLTPHGDGVVYAWEELRAVREEAIEMAMRAAGCGRHAWDTNPDLFFELGETAQSVEHVVGQVLAAQDEAIEKEAA